MKNNKFAIKKILIIALISIYSAINVPFAYALDDLPSPNNTLQGGIEVKKNNNQDEKLFTGKNKPVPTGTTLKMTVSSVLSTGLTTEGDEFFAEIVNDLESDSGIMIPQGTIAHGKVSKLIDSKRLGRDGYINLKFDYLITPDGREIPVEASMTTKRNVAASTAKVILEDTAYTMAGGLIGGILALKFLGLGTAIASNGYTVAGGAGLGAVVGATASIARKGKEVLIAPGDEINVKILSKLDLPEMKEDAFKDEEKILDGLQVDITEYNLEKDPFGELNTITLNINVINKTDKTFSSFDMALVNDYKSVYYPSPFSNTDLWFQKITPNTRLSGKLSFSVDNPKRKHWLVFFDNSTRKPLARISVKNAERKLKKEKKLKNK